MSDLRKLLEVTTPGPWEITDREITKHGGAYDLISGLIWDDFARVAVRFEYDDADSPTGIANARLISLAPDLAAALLEAEEALAMLVDRDIAYDGPKLCIPCQSHSDAIGTASKARATLTEIRKLTGAK